MATIFEIMSPSTISVGRWLPLYPNPERKRDYVKAVDRAKRLATWRRAQFAVVRKVSGRDDVVDAIVWWNAVKKCVEVDYQ